jgi:hypothetical protein
MNGKQQTPPKQTAEQDDRRAVALRENLRKRKTQQQAKAEKKD